MIEGQEHWGCLQGLHEKMHARHERGNGEVTSMLLIIHMHGRTARFYARRVVGRVSAMHSCIGGNSPRSLAAVASHLFSQPPSGATYAHREDELRVSKPALASLLDITNTLEIIKVNAKNTLNNRCLVVSHRQILCHQTSQPLFPLLLLLLLV